MNKNLKFVTGAMLMISILMIFAKSTNSWLPIYLTAILLLFCAFKLKALNDNKKTNTYLDITVSALLLVCIIVTTTTIITETADPPGCELQLATDYYGAYQIIEIDDEQTCAALKNNLDTLPNCFEESGDLFVCENPEEPDLTDISWECESGNGAGTQAAWGFGASQYNNCNITII